MIIKDNKDNKKPLLNGFDKNDCITQMDICIDNKNAYWPQLCDYEQIYYENKDAIFILNTCDARKLLESFKNWGNLDKRIYTYNPEIIKNKTDTWFINFVNNHYKYIITFFSSHKEAKFITYDIEKDNINKLSKYIDIKNFMFPHKNKVTYN